MNQIQKLPVEERRRLNRLYRKGSITRKQFMQLMKNGLFDHERLEMKRKYLEFIKLHRDEWN
ncbi:hypothetical protein C1X05_08730 [Laceyella sacchari]|jgi:hypothetical protein|uniref:Uncharacterized protein n=2 Tax=Laceyella TaxID=292635 RepID=A0AA46AF93_9BACL|nr:MULTISPECIES: hypothetical protein [Laceyella]AUS08922.1 hypothetical protein C1X05_08730 [Laceyella sacchari]MRG27681.1 hypothetical protein [Laceyella tengchongensis]PRZ15313.1 hypothetical protein CLV36_10436 [Laceyella sediminis]SMP18337.1 hypothetical protein SAMN06265361_103135 [Laceyella tengchongensis]